MKMKSDFVFSKPSQKCTFISTAHEFPFSTIANTKSDFQKPKLRIRFLSHCYKIVNDFLMKHIKSHHSHSVKNEMIYV